MSSAKLIFKWYRENKRSRRFVARDDTGEGERNDTGVLMGIDRNDTGMKKKRPGVSQKHAEY